MEENLSGFEKVISTINPNATVLDVGCGGLSGENTTEFLLKHFKPENITGFVKDTDESRKFKELHSELLIINGDFYDFTTDEKYNVIVLDLNIDGNIEQDWTSHGLERMKKMLNPGGILINYVMTTDQYGDPDETPAKLRKHWKEWWGDESFSYEAIGRKVSGLLGWSLYDHAVEERRPYIVWVALQSNE